MKAVLPWIYYSTFRVLAFAVPLVVLLVLQINFWISAIAAAAIGLGISYLFLRVPREKLSTSLYEIRHRTKPVPDNDVEDAIGDEAQEEDAAATATNRGAAGGAGSIRRTGTTAGSRSWRPSDADDPDDERASGAPARASERESPAGQ